MKIQIDDEVREATAEEEAFVNMIGEHAAQHEAEKEAREQARQSAVAKLSALGLTDAEIAALLGA